MATITVASILTKVSTILQDPTNIRWPTDELILWLNDGQREVALYKPNAFVINAAVICITGTKQTLPAAALSLIDVVRNMGTNGTTPGNAIRAVSREILDSQVPNWHSSTASAVTKHFVYSALDSKTFYVYPPQPASSQGYLELVYIAAPTDATSGSTITIDDIYVTGLINYILYRAYSKDAEYANNTALANSYYQQFQGLLQGKVTAEAASNPNQALAPFNPNLPGSMK
jgi:hypothetical protein